MDQTGKCSICGSDYDHFGHNPEPIKRVEERCCGNCNEEAVIPVRIWGMQAHGAVLYLQKYGIKVAYKTA